MRKIKLSFRLCLVAIVALASVPFVAFADTENFYFESFDADYYLSRDEEGVSHLKVVENFTTIFPDYRQNKGICRYIPFTNQNKKNVTLPNLTENNISVLRNGVSEPIYSIEKSGTSYEVCTGDDNYVMGRQIYTFEYDFVKTVTDFQDYQELYWDTNGNGWTQKFLSATARVHFADAETAEAYTGKSWCYVGRYGENGADRCQITEIDDGVQFTTANLGRYENMTFDVELKPGAFVVPEPEKNYILVFVMIGCLILCSLFLISPFKKFLKTRGKARYYKGIFVKPEYQPDSRYSVAEMAENYIGKKKDAKVAALLDMIVKNKIQLIKSGKGVFGQDKWSIKVNDLEGISAEERILLEILNGGMAPSVGNEIKIEKQTATSRLATLGREYDSTIRAALKADGLAERKNKVSNSIGLVGFTIILCFVIALITSGFDTDTVEIDLVGDVVCGEIFPLVIFLILIGTIVLHGVLKKQTEKYANHTNKGLEASRYMDGLKLYIKMAEKDRIEFLQSVQGADISSAGVVRLYEKLLPYAAVLGLEKSWMAELEKYYQLEDVPEPDWYIGDRVSYSVLSVANMAASNARRSTTYSTSSYESSGGGSSSGFSGGGGGGFSGGGGGGGGGHGR